MGERNDRRAVVLSFYIAGIIIGGGILALPFVARDTGLPLLLVLLIIFGALFHIIYTRTLESISEVSKSVVKIRSGQEIFDFALQASGLNFYGKLAFTIGLALYVIPADIVYMLYGMKSILELSRLLGLYVDEALLAIGLVGAILVVVGTMNYVYAKKHVLKPEISFMSKLALLLLLWIFGIGFVGFVSSDELAVVFAVFLFAFSLLIGAFFPERLLRVYYDEFVLDDVLPRHKVSAVLTIIKISLIISIPLVAFFIIVFVKGAYTTVPLLPLDASAIVYSTTIIVFMYVGSGVFNILIYSWVTENMKIGRRAVLLGTLLSMMTYLTFTVLIIFSVNQSILLASDLNREHAFIALSKQLELLGLNAISFLVIIVANVFALISVSVAYMGFTDTLSERLNVERNWPFTSIWLVITILIAIITCALEIFDVTRFATDALGLAGNAGGGLFIMVLPWLLKKDNHRRKDLSLYFLVLVTVLNVFLALNSATLIAKGVAIIATILTLVIGILAILEARRADFKR